MDDSTNAEPALFSVKGKTAVITGGSRGIGKWIAHGLVGAGADVVLVARALGTGVTAKDTEGLRTKLKRLVARQILAEPEPDLFTLASPTSPA